MKKGKFFKRVDKTTKPKIKHNDLKKVKEINVLSAPSIKTVINFHRNH